MPDSDDDSYLLRELVSELSKPGPAQFARAAPDLPAPVNLMVDALDKTLDVVGRTGKEVLYTLLEQQHGLKREDIWSKPGVYISALRSVLGDSCSTIEGLAIDYVHEKEGIEARTLEATVDLLKTRYGTRGDAPSVTSGKER